MQALHRGVSVWGLEEDEKGTPFPKSGSLRSCGVCMGSCPVQIISFKDSSPTIFKEMMTSFECRMNLMKTQDLIFAGERCPSCF
ncbi:MAG: hypothetical protein CM1200mP30_14690 [Pseudomonadota bacterium]|nr:MAG: hypothetical protein CM1200mP30_14690 [Pseudomonadota bacterium]